MVNQGRNWLGAVIYGSLWAVAAPLLMMLWARWSSDLVPLRALHAPAIGVVLCMSGLLLMAAGMVALAWHGHGLPMNAYPPPRYVAQGIYRWLSHPIYVGFGLLSFGAAVCYGSASGLWLVAPVAALTLTALVLGYERRDLRSRFGKQVMTPRIALPREAGGGLLPWERFSVYLLVLLPWLIAYESIYLLGVPRDAIDSHFWFERNWSIWQWTEAVYETAYVMVLATPLIVNSRAALRRFAVSGLLATGVVTLIYVTVPLVAPPRPFQPTSFLGYMLTLERASSNTVASFPAFHFLWPLIAAQALASRGRAWRRAAYTWAFVIAASCITTGMHSLADIAFAGVVFVALHNRDKLWRVLRREAETCANSWREWRIGRMRVINHGLFTAAGAAVGFTLSGWLAGPDLLIPLMALTGFGLLFSALWAQLVEGSSMLLRPLGYYGGVVGGLIGMGVLALLRVNVVTLLGALAVAMPWVQTFGRMRCLVQGCCHGAPTTETFGIRYWHSRSRVTQIAGFTGIPLYPTPLYSILSNVVSGTLLLRLWLLGAAPALVLGLYFILNALARFVEESYRAEPQTPIFGHLHLYHWMAAGGLLTGVLFTLLPASVTPARTPPGSATLWIGTLLLTALTFFVTGVDLPTSNRRFSRLAPADTPPRMLEPQESNDIHRAAACATSTDA